MKLTFRSFATVFLSTLAAVSLAAPTVSLEVRGYASSTRPTTTDQHDDHHTYVGSSFLSASADATASGGGTGIGHAQGDISFGVIHGLVSGAATYGSALPFVVNSSSGFGTLTGIYQDTITIKSATLQFGTPVALQQTLHGHGILDRSGFYSGVSYLALGGGFGVTSNFGIYQSLNQNDVATHIVVQQDLTRTVMVHVGDVLPVFGELDLIAVSSGAPTQPFSGASLDAMNTMGQKLSITTPGAYFTSASGAHYAAVPEPASIAALAVGAIGLLRRRKRN